MAAPVIMPRQGQSVETCIISQWFKKKGEAVKTGEILFSYETDKAAFDVEAANDGVLLEIFFGEGEEVPVLVNVAVIGNPGEEVDVFRPGNKSDDTRHLQSLPSTVIAAPVPSAGLSFRISPRAKNMAVKMGVDPALLKGSGPNGRIIARDVEAAHSDTINAHSGADYADVKLTHVRKIIARTMHESLSSSAQLTHHMSADVRKLLALRAQVKKAREEGSTMNITLNDMVCFAVVKAIEKFPLINSHFLGDKIRTFKKIHLGMAVDTPRGLMVPTVQNAGDLSLKSLSENLQQAADLCRKGNINPELLSGTSGTFTVSNLGNYGVEMFTPIINLPQVAILGVNTIIYRPADLGNGTFGFMPVIGLSLTYDHRAVDGGPATLFLREIKNRIEQFEEKI